MNIHKGLNIVKIWTKKGEVNKITSFLEGNNVDELFDLLFKIYSRDKESFLK